MKVLFAGFGGKTNSSQLVLDRIDYKNTDKLILKNSFIRSPEQLLEKVADDSYDLVVLLGSANNVPRDAIRIETMARGDNIKYHTTVNPQAVADYFVSFGRKVIFSTNCGKYLCNNIYYRALKMARYHRLHYQVVFLHLPPKKKITSLSRLAEEMERLGGAIEKIDK